VPLMRSEIVVDTALTIKKGAQLFRLSPEIDIARFGTLAIVKT
jgi:hypothetical protein